LFSPDTAVFSTNKTGPHDIAEKLLKVALNTITLTPFFTKETHHSGQIRKEQGKCVLWEPSCVTVALVVFYFVIITTEIKITIAVSDDWLNVKYM
jgi:hypothetical protein